MATVINRPDTTKFPDISVADWVTHMFILRRSEMEPELFEHKWWDNRFSTPFDATMEFVRAYEAEGRKLYAREFDFERAQHIHFPTETTLLLGLQKGDERKRQAFSAFWRARQVADASGIPYDFYAREALNQRLKAWQRTSLPKPGHLYKDWVVENVVNRWIEWLDARMVYADHHAYLPQNYCAAPAQDAYYGWLVERVRPKVECIQVLRDMVEDDRISDTYLRNHAGDLFRQL